MRIKQNAKKNRAVRVIPSAPWRVSEVHPLADYRLKVVFFDGTKGEVDISKIIMSKKPGVFKALRDHNLFNQVYLDYGAVTWPGEIDFGGERS